MLSQIDLNHFSPFCLKLSDQTMLMAEQLVRLIPKQRLVVFGQWQNKPVTAKLFFAPRRAQHHYHRELAGVRILVQNHIPTPSLYYQGRSEEAYVLLFERLSAPSLADVLAHDPEETVLQQMLVELATQHVFGVLQRDLHLKNFLWSEEKIYTVDGGQVEQHAQSLSKKTSIAHLALFFSQLNINSECDQKALFRYYAKARGWMVQTGDVAHLLRVTKRHRQTRWHQFKKKIFRESTSFSVLRARGQYGMVNRRYQGTEFNAFLKEPDSVFTTKHILKAGRSATVVKVTLDQQELVVKRYQAKNIWHYLRRALRPTRAYSSWHMAQKMQLLGVLTAEPIAFIERRCLGWRGTSYFVTRYVSAQHAGDYLAHAITEDRLQMMMRIAQLLKTVANIAMIHGDLKITNILINTAEQPVLIDLDGAREARSERQAKAHWRKDLQRFLKNFQHQPALHEKFQQILLSFFEIKRS